MLYITSLSHSHNPKLTWCGFILGFEGLTPHQILGDEKEIMGD